MLDVNSLDLTPGRAEKAVVRFLLICRQTGLQSVSEKNPIKIFLSRSQQTDREEAAGKVSGTATVLEIVDGRFRDWFRVDYKPPWNNEPYWRAIMELESIQRLSPDWCRRKA